MPYQLFLVFLFLHGTGMVAITVSEVYFGCRMSSSKVFLASPQALSCCDPHVYLSSLPQYLQSFFLHFFYTARFLHSQEFILIFIDVNMIFINVNMIFIGVIALETDGGMRIK